MNFYYSSSIDFGLNYKVCYETNMEKFKCEFDDKLAEIQTMIDGQAFISKTHSSQKSSNVN